MASLYQCVREYCEAVRCGRTAVFWKENGSWFARTFETCFVSGETRFAFSKDVVLSYGILARDPQAVFVSDSFLGLFGYDFTQRDLVTYVRVSHASDRTLIARTAGDQCVEGGEDE